MWSLECFGGQDSGGEAKSGGSLKLFVHPVEDSPPGLLSCNTS